MQANETPDSDFSSGLCELDSDMLVLMYCETARVC